jgi:hypothetical protein
LAMREGDVCEVCDLLTLYSMVYIPGLYLFLLLFTPSTSPTRLNTFKHVHITRTIRPRCPTTLITRQTLDPGDPSVLDESEMSRQTTLSTRLFSSWTTTMKDTLSLSVSFHHPLLLESRRYSPLHRVDPSHLSPPKPPRPTPVL